MIDLVDTLPYQNDKGMYDIFYKTACQFVHVDVMSAKSYFSVVDPYDEIDPVSYTHLDVYKRQ